jgi:hypothetical protein
MNSHPTVLNVLSSRISDVDGYIMQFARQVVAAEDSLKARWTNEAVAEFRSAMGQLRTCLEIPHSMIH